MLRVYGNKEESCHSQDFLWDGAGTEPLGRARILGWLQWELFSFPTRLFWNSGILWKSTEIFPKILFLMLFLMNIIHFLFSCPFCVGISHSHREPSEGRKTLRESQDCAKHFFPNKLIYLLKSIFPINPTFP